MHMRAEAIRKFQISYRPRTVSFMAGCDGDVLVAKLGVFESVFLVNQDGKRIKVMTMKIVG